jgi:Leucine-rich repeat (LRR) protein
MSALVTLTEELTEAILQQYGELQKLNLSNNGLQNIENIVKLRGLEKLTLRCNDLIDIRPLAALGALTELDLSDNRILDARYPVPSFTNTPIHLYTHTPIHPYITTHPTRCRARCLRRH